MTGFELDAPKKAGVNLHASTDCVVCSGDRFVVVAIRPAKQSPWMKARGIEPNPDVPGLEEYAPCPSCNASLDTEFFRCDGTRARALDPARVRQMMRS